MPLLKQRSKSFGFCFADFLWRGKESQRGALPLSATASKEVSWLEPAQHYLSSRAATAQRSFTGGACAQAVAIFLVLEHLQRGCSGALINRAFQRGCLQALYLRESPGMCPEALYPRAFQKGYPLARVFRASPSALLRGLLFTYISEVAP